jgi:hypothetical protein
MIFILDRINVNGEEAQIGGLGDLRGAVRGPDGIQHGGRARGADEEPLAKAAEPYQHMMSGRARLVPAT